MSINKDGRIGEQLVLLLFREHRDPNGQRDFLAIQPDALVRNVITNSWHLIESKHQEHYKSPPFDGHGLPRYQIEGRLKFKDDTDVTPWLFVFEKPIDKTLLCYAQRLDTLMSGKYIETQGLKRRIIFPLESFEKIKITSEMAKEVLKNVDSE